MSAPKSTTVWFKGNPLKGEGSWKGVGVGGWWYKAPSVLGGISIGDFDDVPCQVHEWRVEFKEPRDIGTPPSISKGEP